jgi:hypothetical protein
MPIRTRHHRDRYLRRLAADAFFRDVPRHLIGVVSRSVDPVVLEPGAAMRCDPLRETLLISEGHVLVTDVSGHVVAAVGPLGVIGGTRASRDACKIVAASPTRGYVVARRELRALATLAPRVAAVLADGDQQPVSAAGSVRSLARASRP